MSFRFNVLNWRTCVVVCGGVTVWINHDACQQYEKKLDALKSTVNVSSKAGSQVIDEHYKENKQNIYGYFEGKVHSTVPIATPRSPSHDHRSFDMVLLQEYNSTSKDAISRFSPTASYKERVWETTPLKRRFQDSGLQVGVGSVVTIKNVETGVVVRVDPSFFPQMRLKQLFYYDKLANSQETFQHGEGFNRQYHENSGCGGDGDRRGDKSDEKENYSLQRAQVVGGLPMGQTVCILGDFICENRENSDTSHDMHSPTSTTTISVVGSRGTGSDDEIKPIYGSFFGSFKDVQEGKQKMYEGYVRMRLVGGVVAAGAFALLLIFP